MGFGPDARLGPRDGVASSRAGPCPPRIALRYADESVVQLLDLRAVRTVVPGAVARDDACLSAHGILLDPAYDGRLLSVLLVGSGRRGRRLEDGRRRDYRALEDRELEFDTAARDLERATVRRRPGVRPVRACQCEPDAMARLEDPRRRLELELDARRCPRLERCRVNVTVAVREVQHAATHERGRSVGEDVAQACR